MHIAGIDLIRDNDGSIYILEDNLRTPSGVSYMLENREITKRLFPDLLPNNNVLSVLDYPTILHKNLVSLHPAASIPPLYCSRRASTTQPISSIPPWQG